MTFFIFIKSTSVINFSLSSSNIFTLFFTLSEDKSYPHASITYCLSPNLISLFKHLSLKALLASMLEARYLLTISLIGSLS